MIPDELLPHVVTVVAAGTTTDEYGDTTLSWADDDVTETTCRAWVQQTTRTEGDALIGDRVVSSWLLITNLGTVTARDRISWDGLLFTVEGEPSKVATPAGPHHLEATLKRVEG